jgi:hypothetical protein
LLAESAMQCASASCDRIIRMYPHPHPQF